MDEKKDPKTFPLNATILRMYEEGYSMDDIVAATGLYRFDRSMLFNTPKSGKFIDRFKAEWKTATGMIRPYL